MAEVISDTSPLQYLHQLGLLGHLHRLVGTLTVPEAVAMELDVGRARGLDLPSPGAIPWMRVRKPEGGKVLPLVRDLGPGETAALALALESSGATVLMDDGHGRRVALALGIAIRGTAGILLDLKGKGLIPAVLPLLNQLDRLRFRLASEARKVVLAAAGEVDAV